MRCTQNIASVPIKHFEREVGESNYTFGQLLRLWSSIIGFSVIPLRVASIAGFFFAGVGILAAIAIVIRKMVDPNLSMGWPSLMCAISFFFGLNVSWHDRRIFGTDVPWYEPGTTVCGEGDL